MMVDGSVAQVSLFYFYLISVLYHADAPGKGPHDGGWVRGASVDFLLWPYFFFFTTQTVLEKGHVMVDGTVVLVTSVAFLLLLFSVLYHADAPGKGPCDGGRISGASVDFLLLPYFFFFTTQTLLEKGHVMVDGSVALVSQQAWIFNGTLRDNILMGSEFKQVLQKRNYFLL
jgi:hypothetical protein